MPNSNKTLKAESFAINAAKFPPIANPRPSQESLAAYRYILSFDLENATTYNLFDQLPGLNNVVKDEQGSPLLQKIFQDLTTPMKQCLYDMEKSHERLHFISGVAGSGKSYLMETLTLFSMYGCAAEARPEKFKVLYILNNNTGIEPYCDRLTHSPDIMKLYPLEGEVKSHANNSRPEDPVEDANLTEEFIAFEVLNELCTKINQDDTTAMSAKRANRVKSFHEFASQYLEEHQQTHPLLRHALNRIKAGEVLSKEEYTNLKADVKVLQHDTLRHHNGVVATTPVGATPLLVRNAFKPDLVIIDDAATMDEASILILIAHYSPKAWVIVGDIAQKPPRLTMEHDFGPGKVSSNPFAAQKQTSLLHRVVESGAQHSALRKNMRAHGNVAGPVNSLFYNGIMAFHHEWKEMEALFKIITWYQDNVNPQHPKGECFAQIEFTHARATMRSSSKVNITHAGWILEQIEGILKSDLQGVGKNSSKPLTVLVIAAYKEQVLEVKQRFLQLAKTMKLSGDDISRIKVKAVDNAQGEEADFVIYDMVTTSTPAFDAAEFRNTLGLSRSRAFLVVISNRGNFIGHEVNWTIKECARELSRIYDHIARLNVNQRVQSCKNCQTHEHPSSKCEEKEPVMTEAICERNSCGKKGHTTAYCPTRICGNCSERGHTSGECPLDEFLCSACGRIGHDFFNCPSPEVQKWCNICKGFGHTHFKCPTRQRYQKGWNKKAEIDITRNNCHQTGHRASDCTEPRPCTECGEVGHWRKECPNRRCKWCDKTDHLADKCPEDLCLWCFQVGHLARDCNNPRAKCDNCDAPHLTRHCRGRGGTLKKKGKGKARAQQQIVQNRGRSSFLEEFNAMDGAQTDTGGDDWGAGQTDTGGDGGWSDGDTTHEE
ncbi:hypothetical protein LB507_007280 [Fusarium sp. FIESC RH6]|nr:hypothetical protein LB507_007280 [Fusarium sp. FIESC RH6]